MNTCKIHIISRLQNWMDSEAGQTFLNYAYSWGASIVILGTLFKLTHLPGANFFLYIGMGTEVLVFFIAAFDRPFEKGQNETQTSSEEVEAFWKAAFESNDNKNRQKIDDAINRITQIPDCKEIKALKEVFKSTAETYRLKLEKLKTELCDTDEVHHYLVVQLDYIKELNAIYRRMIDAAKGN